MEITQEQSLCVLPAQKGASPCKEGGNRMEYVIRLSRDPEANVWIAVNDYIPLTLESGSLDHLMQRVKEALPELLELNGLPKPGYLYFIAEYREEVSA